MSKTINQVSVFLENRPHQLDHVLEILADAGVNIQAMTISETDKYGILRMIVAEPNKVRDLISKENYLVHLNPVFLISIEHFKGGFKKLINCIAGYGINIDYMYSMIYSGQSKTAFIILSVDNKEKMTQCLDEHPEFIIWED